MVEFTAHSDVDLRDYRVLRASGVHGTLGLININADVFLCVISGAVRVATGMYTREALSLLAWTTRLIEWVLNMDCHSETG